jgi:hypothetical protein
MGSVTSRSWRILDGVQVRSGKKVRSGARREGEEKVGERGDGFERWDLGGREASQSTKRVAETNLGILTAVEQAEEGSSEDAAMRRCGECHLL